MRCGTPEEISSARIFTILQPKASAEFNPKIIFSAFLKILRVCPLFMTRSSMVPGLAQFIALHKTIPSDRLENSASVSTLIGMFDWQSGSDDKLLFSQLENALRSANE